MKTKSRVPILVTVKLISKCFILKALIKSILEIGQGVRCKQTNVTRGSFNYSWWSFAKRFMNGSCFSLMYLMKWPTCVFILVGFSCSVHSFNGFCNCHSDILRVGVTLAGHQKKILNSVQMMRAQMNQIQSVEVWPSPKQSSGPGRAGRGTPEWGGGTLYPTPAGAEDRVDGFWLWPHPFLDTSPSLTQFYSLVTSHPQAVLKCRTTEAPKWSDQQHLLFFFHRFSLMLLVWS